MSSQTLSTLANWSTIIAVLIAFLLFIGSIGAFVFRWFVAYGDIQELKKIVKEDIPKRFDRINQRVDTLYSNSPISGMGQDNATSPSPDTSLPQEQEETFLTTLQALQQGIQLETRGDQNPLDDEGV